MSSIATGKVFLGEGKMCTFMIIRFVIGVATFCVNFDDYERFKKLFTDQPPWPFSILVNAFDSFVFHLVL